MIRLEEKVDYETYLEWQKARANEKWGFEKSIRITKARSLTR